MLGACRPCSDAELLLAACTSDFGECVAEELRVCPTFPHAHHWPPCLFIVIHGTIRGVAHDTELQESVITVAATRVIRQTLPLFQEGSSEGQGQASIRTLLRCGVRPGPGSFLFMGWSRFGEAWLGCAPRFQEFSRVYSAALTAHLNPCEVALD